MLSFLLYVSHLTSFLQLWPHILTFLLLLWWINCSCSTFVHLLHFFTDATLSHFFRVTAQLILFSFIIRISLSTALLPSTHIHTVKLLPQKKERRIPLLSPCILPIMVSFLLFPLEQNSLKTLFILALYKLSFSIISWCHYIRALTYHSPEAVLVKVTVTSLCKNPALLSELSYNLYWQGGLPAASHLQ